MVRGFQLPDLGPPGLWRFLYGCRPEETEEEALAEAVVEERLQAVLSKAGRYETRHRTIYRFARVADTFRTGGCCSRAMLRISMILWVASGSIVDCRCMNLTDKLAAVWHGECEEEVLDRYVRQRRTANMNRPGAFHPQ